MGAWENECQISQNYIFHMKFTEIYNSCEIWHSFSRIPMRNFLWCYYRWLITSLGLKNIKKNAIFFKLFCYKVFVHWDLKITQFPSGFPLKNISPLSLTYFFARMTCRGLSASQGEGILQRDEKVHYRSGNEGNILFSKWILVTFHLMQLFTP